MSRLKKVAAALANMGRHDLAREVALASLEMKGQRQHIRQASSMDALQRRVDEAFDQVTDLINDLKRNGPDPVKQNKLDRAKAEWARMTAMLDEAIQQEMDSIPFDADPAWGE